MRSLLLFTAWLLCLNIASAQQRKTYIVKAGEIPGKVLPDEAVYVLPAFTEGTIFLKDGSASKQQFNYNILLGEMQFLDSNRKVLAIAEPNTIRHIVIDTLTFYYDKTYLQLISKIDSFKLAIKEVLMQLPYQIHGGYDVSTAVSSITTYGSISSNGAIASLQVKKDVRYEKKESYFLGDRFNHFLKANKKSFFTLFPDKRYIIQKFVNDNNIDFNSKKDLKKLLHFCVVT